MCSGRSLRSLGPEVEKALSPSAGQLTGGAGQERRDGAAQRGKAGRDHLKI